MNPIAIHKLDVEATLHTTFPEYDYDLMLKRYKHTGSAAAYVSQGVDDSTRVAVSTDPNPAAYGRCGDIPSSCFAMAIDLETSNGLEISGLNAEEQSDISLIARYSHAQQPGFVYDVFCYIDAMIVLRENNVMELIQ